jgi:hypothetical protein
MRVTGTVSDFDAVGGLGLIIADDCDDFLPFNARGMPAALRRHIEVGSRVRFRRQDSQPAARAIEVIPLGDRKDDSTSLAAGPRR